MQWVWMYSETLISFNFFLIYSTLIERKKKEKTKGEKKKPATKTPNKPKT
jgi:hypothetical protein